MKKIPLLTAAAVGYVLGARAGRERYEQIRTQTQRLAGDPRVQQAKEKAQEKVTDATSSATDKLRHESSVQPAP